MYLAFWNVVFVCLQYDMLLVSIIVSIIVVCELGIIAFSEISVLVRSLSECLLVQVVVL